jgi:hypothetical protein
MFPKELEIPYSELDRLAEGLAATFIQRRDLYARQLDDGRYVSIQKPLKFGHVLGHLRGNLTLGAYVLDASSSTRFVVFDADDDRCMGSLISTAQDLANQGVNSYVEGSRRGGHLWLFFSQPTPGKVAREFGHGVLAKHSLQGVELFPKQDRLQDGPGSLIRMPFGIHHRTGQRYGFFRPDLQPLAPTLQDQIRLMSLPETVPEQIFETYRSFKPSSPHQVQNGNSSEPNGSTLSERIKSSINVRDYVSQYVELSPAGIGLCPFHDDHHPSFAVNAEGNYWHCFAGCGGGSIIDFWMRWQGCDFKTAIRELAGMLLEKE